MNNPLDKMKKLRGRSWSELRERGKQTLSAYSEQIGIRGNLPGIDELRKLYSNDFRSHDLDIPNNLLDAFYEIGDERFFRSVVGESNCGEDFKKLFGRDSVENFVGRSKKIAAGKFDLLGYLGLDFKDPVDWHFEPIADKQSPLQHWKLFDEMDSEVTGDKKIIWELNRHQHFFTLGVAYMQTGNEEFASVFARHLKGWMDQNSPGIGVNWMSSLEVAFRAMSWIWAFHLFRGSQTVTPGLFQEALRYLYVHGIHLEQYLSTYYSPNTHLTGEALGLYYLGTQLPFLARSKHWRVLGKKILKDEAKIQIHQDGVYFEQSTWYQRYTADFYLHFLILADLAGDDIDRETKSRVERCIEFMMYVTRPDGTTPLIGDDDGGRMLPLTNAAPNDFRGTVATGASIFSRGDFKFISGGISQELFWLTGKEGVANFEALKDELPEQTSKMFEIGGYAVMRDGWSKTDNFLIFDAGELGALGAGHGHADVLSFELAALGKTLLVDPGTYSYHKSAEIRDAFRNSNGHNTLSVDGESSSEPGGKFDWKSYAKPSLRKWLSYDRFDFIEASHDGFMRFEDSAAAHTRSMMFLRNEYWIMRDFVNTLGHHQYQQNFHFNPATRPSIVAKPDGGEFVGELDGSGNGIGLFTFGDQGKWEKTESWVSTLHGRRESAPFLQFVSNGNGPQEFFTFMLPRVRGDKEPAVFETDVPGGRAFVINFGNYQDLFVYADPYGDVIRTEIFNTNFRFMWARLSQGDLLPEEFVMIDGSEFSLDERVIISNPERLECAIARRFGKKLYLRTNESIFSVSLPSKRSTRSYIVKPNSIS